MADIEKMADYYKRLGYSDRNADARVCQDIILKAVSKSNLAGSITVKGGVVMRSITGDVRRATEDLDLDFIRYSSGDRNWLQIDVGKAFVEIDEFLNALD